MNSIETPHSPAPRARYDVGADALNFQYHADGAAHNDLVPLGDLAPGFARLVARCKAAGTASGRGDWIALTNGERILLGVAKDE